MHKNVDHLNNQWTYQAKKALVMRKKTPTGVEGIVVREREYGQIAWGHPVREVTASWHCAMGALPGKPLA